jgi:hypothetical protein
MSSHNWKCEGCKWVCAACGHSFKWSAKHGPTKFDHDGSPALEDPTWFEFQMAGLLSFVNTCKGMDENTRRKFVQMVGMDPKLHGSHAAAFEHCMLAREMNNYVIVSQVMDG